MRSFDLSLAHRPAKLETGVQFPEEQTFEMYAPAEVYRYEGEIESHFEGSLAVFRMSLPVHSVIHFSTWENLFEPKYVK